jgi:hypothetical protein
MRTSQKVLLSGLIIVLGIVAAGVVGLRSVVSEFVGDEAFAASGTFDREPLDLSTRLSDFDRVLIRSAWDVEIERGANWAVDVSVPDEAEPYLRVGVADGVLVLDIDRDERPWWSRRSEGHNRARVTMPSLAGLEVQGAATVAIDEFRGDELEIDIAGAGNVDSRGGRYDKLDLRIGGAANVELDRMIVTNADVQLSGAANVELTMGGGDLTGSIAGFGRLQYAGDVALEDVDVSGFSSVERSRP